MEKNLLRWFVIIWIIAFLIVLGLRLATYFRTGELELLGPISAIVLPGAIILAAYYATTKGKK
jgi:hypothetical protein